MYEFVNITKKKKLAEEKDEALLTVCAGMITWLRQIQTPTENGTGVSSIQFLSYLLPSDIGLSAGYHLASS